MRKALLRTALGSALCLTLSLPSYSQSVCDCVGAGNCPSPINDNSTTIVELPVNLPGNPELGSCPLEKVCITLTHTWIGDLSISLESPNGEHYLIMADFGNNYGECGNQQDNAEFCIVRGTNHPLTNNTEYICNSTTCSLGTCCLNGDWTVPCGDYINSPLTDATKAPHCDLNDFNLPGAPANGVWKLLFLDVCQMDIGTLVNASLGFGCSGNTSGTGCEANGGVLNTDDAVFCGADQWDIGPHYCWNEPSADYSYAYIIAKNDTILAHLPQPDLTGYPLGQYEIWGFSYASSAENQLSSLVGSSLQANIALFDSGSAPFCGDFSINGFNATVVNLPNADLGPDLVLDCWETSHQLSPVAYSTGNNFSNKWTLPSGLTIPNQSNILAASSGTYIFSVSDTINGCAASDTLQLTIPPPLIASIATQTASCDQADGAASVGLQPGINNATFSWSNGASTQINSGLSQGWYSVTVSDAYCSYHQNAYVDENRTCKVTIRGKILNDGDNADCLTDANSVGVECIMLHLMPADIYT
ncbi:MAG: proprotein convertase P-domain-containing protein, partial [Saprospiraceae bacterium]|nr:proprotein convertase P-domain-containing protein [Saprospiraceae bacterium]